MTTLIVAANSFGMTGLANWFKEVQAKLAYRAKVRSTIKQLSALSNRELNDIGISRGDIYGIAVGDSTLERVRKSAVDTNTNLKGWV